jgi:hypothetical protein
MAKFTIFYGISKSSSRQNQQQLMLVAQGPGKTQKLPHKFLNRVVTTSSKHAIFSWTLPGPPRTGREIQGFRKWQVQITAAPARPVSDLAASQGTCSIAASCPVDCTVTIERACAGLMENHAPGGGPSQKTW